MTSYQNFVTNIYLWVLVWRRLPIAPALDSPTRSERNAFPGICGRVSSMGDEL